MFGNKKNMVLFALSVLVIIAFGSGVGSTARALCASDSHARELLQRPDAAQPYVYGGVWDGGLEMDIRDYCVKPDVFYDDFEGDLSKWDHLEKRNAQGGAIKTDPKDPNNRVFMAYTWRGANPLIRPRSELRVDNYEKLGRDYWYSWRFMIDPNKRHNSPSEIIGQWHSKPDFESGETWDDWDDGSFAIALELESFTDELEISATYMDVIREKTGIYVERGVWHEIVWHIKHSTGEDGYVEAWINGEPLINFNGEQTRLYGKTAYNSSGSYLKIGSYRYNYTSWTNPVDIAAGESCIYYDDVRVGSGLYRKLPSRALPIENNFICDMGFAVDMFWFVNTRD